MKLKPQAFAQIQAGTKVIESRLYDDKRQQIEIGDTITFMSGPDLTEHILVTVRALLRYPSFADLAADFPPEMFGNTTTEDVSTDVQKYYSKDQENQYGVVGIKIARV